jgi:hypothetical protein
MKSLCLGAAALLDNPNLSLRASVLDPRLLLLAVPEVLQQPKYVLVPDEHRETA